MAKGHVQVFFRVGPEVEVPAKLRGLDEYWLDLGWDLGLPTEINDDGVQVTMLFDDVPFDVAVPWVAITAIVCRSDGTRREWVYDYSA